MIVFLVVRIVEKIVMCAHLNNSHSSNSDDSATNITMSDDTSNNTSVNNNTHNDNNGHKNIHNSVHIQKILNKLNNL